MRRKLKSRTIRSIVTDSMKDYIYYLSDRRLIIVNNFLAGLFRGLGIAIGFSVLGAIALYVLSVIFQGKIPMLE